jgi:RNA polymerase sigma-54 factor
MALNQRLDIRQSQNLVMTPQLQQAIKLLQYSNIELNEFVETQLLENPLLEQKSDDDGGIPDENDAIVVVSGGEPQEADVVIRDGVDFEPSLDGNDTDFANVWDDGSRIADVPSGAGWEAYATKEESLREHLTRQITLELPDPVEQAVAMAIVDQLDDAGYFSGDFAEIAGLTGVDSNTVSWVHSRILRFDPIGIGSRSLAEYLRLQLTENGAMSPPMECLLEHLQLIASRDFVKLSKLCDVTLSSLQELIAKLRTCAARPTAAFDAEPAATVIPDVLVYRGRNQEWVVELNPDAVPQVIANQDYYAIVKKNARNQKDVEFVTTQWHSANWLVKALEQRANSILKVASCIVRTQSAFLDEGVSGLRPLTLQDVATEVEVHESTVSRVTSGKYMITPRGIFELKYFFTAGTAAINGGDSQSVEVVRHRIKQLVDDETLSKVLSDEDLVGLLHSEGMKVARRTVAKYRESMRIPSSAQRRRLLRLEAG